MITLKMGSVIKIADHSPPISGRFHFVNLLGGGDLAMRFSFHYFDQIKGEISVALCNPSFNEQFTKILAWAHVPEGGPRGRGEFVRHKKKLRDFPKSRSSGCYLLAVRASNHFLKDF